MSQSIQNSVKYIVLLTITVILIATLSNAYAREDQPSSSDNWTLLSTDDEKISLSHYQGKPVILVFWATWCPYCKKLLPGLERLHQQYAAKGLTILAVNIMEDWKPKVYWRNHEYSFPALLEWR